MNQSDPSQGPTVWVRRQMNDWRGAEYRLEDVDNPQWDRVSGGVQIRAPRYLLYGYVEGDGMLQGEVAHSGVHGPHPHRIKVCILKVDNSADVFLQLQQRA